MAWAAVVIVNHRTAELALRCARAALADPVVEELVVVDNASGDGSAERLREAGVRVLESPENRGFAAGVNAGFAATESPFVILLNPDTLPRPGSLGTLVERLEGIPGAGTAAPRLLFPDGSPQPNAYRRFPGLASVFVELCLPAGFVFEHLPHPYRLPPGATRAAWAMGAALAIRREAYRAAGPFDEGFFLYFEETEWQRRLRGAGWTVELVPEAEVVHELRAAAAGAVPPHHYVLSARRYLRGRGYPGPVVGAALRLGVLGSRLGLRLLALLFPRRRQGLLTAARAYDELWRRAFRVRGHGIGHPGPG